MPANKYRGEVAIEIDGREIILRPTFAAIVAWEEATGQTTVILASERARAFSARNITEIIFAAAQAAGNPVSRAELESLIEARGLGYMIDPALSLVGHALVGGSEPKAGEGMAADEAT